MNLVKNSCRFLYKFVTDNKSWAIYFQWRKWQVFESSPFILLYGRGYYEDDYFVLLLLVLVPPLRYIYKRNDDGTGPASSLLHQSEMVKLVRDARQWTSLESQPSTSS